MPTLPLGATRVQFERTICRMTLFSAPLLVQNAALAATLTFSWPSAVKDAATVVFSLSYQSGFQNESRRNSCLLSQQNGATWVGLTFDPTKIV